MAELTFVTGNQDKFITALHTAKQHAVSLVQASPDIDEVQSESAEYIARQKAQAAYDVLNKPLVISDDSWAVPGLGGFPGAYMKSMNHWLSADDFIRLTANLADRTCVLSQILVYQDELEQVIFIQQVKGTILTVPHGSSSIPWANLAALDGDNGKTIAEVGEQQKDRSGRDAAKIWHELFSWYKEHRT